MIKAVGVMLIANGRVLLLKRSDQGDAPGMWALPGGKVEEGESLLDALKRECEEEIGPYKATKGFQPLTASDDGRVDYTTYTQSCDEFLPNLNDEHTEHIWSDLGGPYPEPLHPGVRASLEKLTMDELDVAEGVRDGRYPSPSRFQNIMLVAMRITGTGVAYRNQHDEFVFRDAALFLNDRFVQRCNGLMVIAEHPDKASLDSEEFADRVIGAVCLPYIKGDEVWGIVKVYDQAMMEMLSANQLSTSPTVVFRAQALNTEVALEDGSTLLIEGKPSLLDHLAVCVQGVWDKGKPPSGVELTQAGNSTSPGDISMADEKTEIETKAVKENNEDGKKAELEGSRKEPLKAADAKKADAEGDENSINDKLDALIAMCDSTNKRMDAMEEDDKKKADKARADAMTEEEKAKEEDDKKKADKARKDTEESEMKAREKADADTRQRIADLESRMPKDRSDDDEAMMADAQAKADSVYQAHGKHAPRPLMGESHIGYRRRLVNTFKDHSSNWKAVDLNLLPKEAFAIAEQQVYADAMVAANNPIDIAAGVLRERVTTDSTGRRITSFQGEPRAWLGQFQIPSRRLVGINKERA